MKLTATSKNMEGLYKKLLRDGGGPPKGRPRIYPEHSRTTLSISIDRGLKERVGRKLGPPRLGSSMSAVHLIETLLGRWVKGEILVPPQPHGFLKPKARGIKT